MAIEIKVPTLGESVTSGILAAWKVADGDLVEKDQVLYELETDKITSEGTAEASGRIELKVEEGEEVEIGQLLAVIDETAEATAGGGEAAAAEEGGSESAETSGSGGEGGSGAPAPAPSPAVRKIAEESGLDPATVAGTGKGGRVTKADMLAALEEHESGPAEEVVAAPASAEIREVAPPAAAPAAAKGEPGEKPVTRSKLSPLRRSIANRLVSVQNESAILTTFNEADMSGIMGLRKKHQEEFVARHGIKLGFMSFFVKACVEALRQVPGLNARIEGDELVQNHFYDIGVAVSTDRGLLVPVLRDCEQKSMAAIEKDIAAYAGKAREGKIGIEDLQGGVFSLTNGGIFGSMLSTPILNPPQAGILGMHNITERPVAVNGEVVIRPMMYLALSYDHRIVDGKEAVTFLVKVKEAVEDPVRLLFGE
jgi:2-oxoglutarate dehydrogenase E2 component (dihydrolipoamide succinyltransferase)